MNTRISKFIFMLAVVLIGTTAFSRAIPQGHDPITLIRNDFQAGTLTVDQKANLYIDAIKYPDRLPPQYAVSRAQADFAAACPTMALKEIRMEWQDLSPVTQERFSDAFARLSTAFTYVTASGFFTIHYDTSGGNAVPSIDGDSDNIPDFIEHCAAYLDSSLDKHLAQGYLPPPSDGGLGGDTTFDVYFQEMGFYGYAVPEDEGPAPWNDYSSHLTLHRDFFGFPPNNDPEGDQLGAAKVTAAHEFHHCVQFAYDASEDSWFMELDATYMEDIVFDATDDNYNYLLDFFSAPQKSLMENSIRMYACFTWDLYLAQKFDTSLIRSIWEGARSSTVFTALSDSLQAGYGWSQDSAFADYAVWNFITNTRDDGQHHQEATAYPHVNIGRTHSTYPVGAITGPSNPAGYGATYVQFFPSSSIGKLQINVDGENARQWKFYIVKSTANNVHTIEEIQAPSPSYSGSITILQMESYFRIALIAVNVSEFSAGGIFTYSATVTPPYELSASILTDTAVYSGGVRNFSLKLSNQSILPDVFSIVVSDDLGWILTDTLSVAMPATHDSTIHIAVSPPQGTPLATHSTLSFVTSSWGDTLLVDTQTIAAVTMLQRGDNNFSGLMNILDLNYLVAYVFAGGPAPMPVPLAGDYDCNNVVNVLDIIAQVNRFFSFGPKPLCNPF